MMKSRIFSSLASLAAALCFALPMAPSNAHADIHNSIADQEDAFSKLGRGMTNLVFGFTELPMNMIASNGADGHLPAFTAGKIKGAKRSVIRVAYGLFEVATFPLPLEGNTYASPFHRRDTIYYHDGYAEHPPELSTFQRVWYTRITPGH